MNKYLGVLLFLGVGLLGCVPEAEEGAGASGLAATVQVTRGVVGEEATGVSVVRPSPTFEVELVETLPWWHSHLKTLDDIYCGNLQEGIEEKSYWVDDFIPGESTIEEALQIIDELPEEKKPIQWGESSFFNPEGEDYYLLIFEKDVLFMKYEPRMYLGDIIKYYGEPTRVTWNIRYSNLNRINWRMGDTWTIDTTTLYFSQSNAIFLAEGQTVGFYADTEFIGYSITPAYYEEIFAEEGSKVSDDEEFVQHFPWPCGESRLEMNSPG